MRHAPVALVLLLAACSSGSGTTTLSSPSPVLPSSLAPTTAAPVLPTTSPTASATPAPRRTASPVATVRPVATSHPRPSPTPAPSPTRSGATVALDEVTGYQFSPSTLTLPSGDRLLVTNRDVAAHTFTISGLGVDSGNMGEGDTFRYTFRAPGRWTFVCTYHQGLGMTGTLVVTS